MKLDRVIAVRNSKTVYHDGNRAIKVFNWEYAKADVLNEALNQARMEEMGLCVPSIMEVTTIDGKWAIVSEFIQGRTLAQLMQENPEKKSAYLSLFVDLQMSVHAKSCPALHSMKDRMSRKIIASDIDATTRYDLLFRLEGMPRHTNVCHGDFNPSNIIMTQDGTPCILDWSHVTQGNAPADAARTYLLFRLEGDDDGAKAYLDLFCRRSDTEKESVRRWIPIVAAAQSVKGNARERAFLLPLVGQADFEV